MEADACRDHDVGTDADWEPSRLLAFYRNIIFFLFFSEVTSVVKIHEVYLAYHIKFSFFRFGRTDDQFLKVLQNLRNNLGLVLETQGLILLDWKL